MRRSRWPPSSRASSTTPASPERLAAVAGGQTERLVGLYGCADRARSHPTFTSDAPAVVDRVAGQRTSLDGEMLRALVELTLANELDVLPRAPELLARHGATAAATFRRWRPLLSAPARTALEGWLATASTA